MLNNHIIYHIPHPKEFFIYITYNTLKKNMLRVKVNQKVLCGQPLTFGDNWSVPIHAPTSGLIKNIEFNSNSINYNKKNIKITIISDYLDQWIKRKKISNYKLYSSQNLIKISEATPKFVSIVMFLAYFPEEQCWDDSILAWADSPCYRFTTPRSRYRFCNRGELFTWVEEACLIVL